MKSLKELFNDEVERIRENPLLAGNWGYYQDYLREHFAYAKGSHSISFQHLSDDVIAEVGIFSKDDKAYIQIRMPKSECVRPMPSKYEKHEMDILTEELPDDLQKMLMSYANARANSEDVR